MKLTWRRARVVGPDGVNTVKGLVSECRRFLVVKVAEGRWKGLDSKTLQQSPDDLNKFGACDWCNEQLKVQDDGDNTGQVV